MVGKNRQCPYLARMTHAKFLLSTDESEILLYLEELPSLQDVAERIGRDHSIVARSLKRIADRLPAVEKKAGRWTLTKMGRRLNEITRESISHQSAAILAQTQIRLGTNREFAARVVGPNFESLREILANTQISVNAYEAGTEQALLGGQIDIGFDCDRPIDPDIAYKLLVDEPIAAVCSPQFAKKFKTEITRREYFALPHLFCERLNPNRILSKTDGRLNISARFNDIATTRSVCMSGVGWALLPTYAVRDELNSKKLVQIDPKLYRQTRYGIWWPRRKQYLKPSVDKLVDWLNNQKL